MHKGRVPAIGIVVLLGLLWALAIPAHAGATFACQAQGGTLVGRVIDYTTGRAVTGATVRLEVLGLTATSGDGITIINFGIGSPNAATICDLLSAVAPKAVLFLGKCGGLKQKSPCRGFHPADCRDPG